MRNSLLRHLVKLPALAVMGGVWFLSSQSILPQPKGILGYDKLQHLLAYGVLAFCLGFWFPPEKRTRPAGVFVVFTLAVSSLYGVIDEVHQRFVPGRDCNVWDWLADTLGAALGTALVALVTRLWAKRRAGEERP
jgi:VanZ family protein